MKRIHFLLRVIWLYLIILVPVACGSCSESTSDLDLTATADLATQLHLCCTATPQIAATRPPDNSKIVLDRGNAQRTGVYDVPSIRNQPEVKWQTKVSATRLMPPMLADGILYTGSGDGVLYALDVETGEIIWSTGGFGQLESTGAIAGDIIVSGGYSQLVRALNRNNGNLIWSYKTCYLIQASPLIVQDTVIIATAQVVYALDLQTGQVFWQVTTGNENAFMGGPAYENGIIYTTSGKRLIALDGETGKEIWAVKKDQNFLGVAVGNQRVYVGNWDLCLYAFDQSTGEESWKFKGNGVFWSAPAVNGDGGLLSL
jgi:eukaryotic-like serine/threonine-protein kinase